MLAAMGRNSDLNAIYGMMGMNPYLARWNEQNPDSWVFTNTQKGIPKIIKKIAVDNIASVIFIGTQWYLVVVCNCCTSKDVKSFE